MNERTKRLRIFAGPNGSGKSTLYNYLTQISAFHSYYHINPDTIAKDLSVSLNLDNWPIDFSYTELLDYLKTSPFQSLVKFNMSELLEYHDNRISLNDKTFYNSYLAAAVADFLRIKMLQSDSSFSFESVFSHDSKIHELEKAKKANFKIYLYFITTSDPLINIQRVKNRADSGGHDVPEEKISARYLRTMNNLCAAFKLSNKAYLIDNSSEKTNSSFDFFMEKNEDKIFLSDTKTVPQWFDEYLLNYLV